MSEKIVIAIDGLSSCGKSTIARELAKGLGFKYIDTGAMYRAVTLHFLRNSINLKDKEAVQKALDEVHIDFRPDEYGRQFTYLNGEDVEDEIRQMNVSRLVSDVSAIKEVRQELVAQQQRLGRERGVVMDGRDIGTVVFPDAELKIFMTADEQVRVHRRFYELQQKGHDVTHEEVEKNLLSRDYIDTHREESPLKQAEEALILDNTDMNEQEQLAQALKWAKQRMKEGRIENLK